jgi:hypothetical protein
MNYAYLFVDNLNGHSYNNGLNELKSSVLSLKNIESYDSIQVFNNEIDGKNVKYFKKEDIIHNQINLSRNYKGSDNFNPINILVEKIICLMNYDENEDIVLLDIDTSFTNKVPKNYWNENYIVLDNIEYPIMQWRNLDKILPQISWKNFDIKFDDSFMMYNTGVIYIPKKIRRELCEKALSIVDYLNDNFSPEERCGNKLDEQIALSIVLHDTYGRFGHIKLSNEFIHHHWDDRQNGIEWWKNITDNKSKIEKLPISIGILSWNSNQTLRNTLESYRKNGLFEIVNDVTLFFQEVSDEDRKISKEYDIPFIGYEENIGIGNAFIKLSEISRSDNLLLLEHDWELIEDKETTFNRLKSGIELLNSDYSVVRYRHRKNPGYPLYTQLAYQGNELNHYDESIQLTSPHLMDCIHWIENPDVEFPDKISKEGEYFFSTSRWSNFTNNPCMYKKNFYINTVFPFKQIKEKDSEYYKNFGNNLNHYGSVEPWKHSLEVDIGYWWSRQEFKIAWSEGLFKHNDVQKYNQVNVKISEHHQNTISIISPHRENDLWSPPLAILNEFKRLGWKSKIYTLFDSNDNYVDDNIYELLKTNPDIIMHMDWGQHVSPILTELRETGAYCIMESGDDPQRFNSNVVKASWFDLILSPDIRSVEEYKKMGYNVEWWTHFSDTTTYHPLNIEPSYVAVCSRGMGNDAFIIDNLSKKYPDKIVNQNGFHGSEHNKFLNSGFIVLQQSRYGEITRRIFEGMSCKKLVITDRLNSSTKIQELFVDGEDIVFYDGEEDCLNKVVYYFNNQQEARRIAENGYNKVINNHTQKQRVELIINKWKSIIK